MDQDEKKELLKNTCDCPVCSLAGQVVEFTESLLGPREMEALKAHVDIVMKEERDPEQPLSVEPAMGLIVTSALAEIAFRQLVSPKTLHECVDAAYNLRIKKLMERTKKDPQFIDEITQLFREGLEND